jgi:non-specific serine/threonine protein kinase
VQGVLTAFQASAAQGLFELAAQPAWEGLPPELAYWRQFAGQYLAGLCRTPQGVRLIAALPPLAEAEALAILQDAPPMPGAEYLDPTVLASLWSALDDWVRAEAAAGGGLEAFLSTRAPLWHQVGRVCLHLAENRNDPEYPFAFLATYAPLQGVSERVRYQPLSRALQEFAGENNRQALVNLLTPISRAAQKSTLIRELLDSSDIYHPLAWTAQEAHRFLREIPLFEESGVLVRVPDWWARRPRPQVTVQIGSRSVASIGADAVLDFDIGMALGDEQLNPEELAGILAGGEGLFLLKGRWVEVDPQRLSEAMRHWQKLERLAKSGGISFIEGMRLLAGAPLDLKDGPAQAVAQWSEVVAGPWLRDLLASLRSPEGASAALPGPSLQAVLRPYQQAGLNWLWLLSRLGLGACLADDMGLGKTIQVLALLLLVKQEGQKPGKPSILVLPASLLANWKAEMERFAPSLDARFIHPSMQDYSTAQPSDLDSLDLVVTTYGMLSRQPWFEAVSWNLAILDEAQAIKNPSSGQTKATKRLKARSRIALTGTPVENRLSDLWSIFDFICPGLLGSANSFKGFVKTLEERTQERYTPLRKLVQPYILRRLKTDRSVIPDLPEKTEVAAYCGLSKAQAVLYNAVTEDLAAGLTSVDGMARRGLVLASLMKLKQLCNHPAQLLGDGQWDEARSSKFARLASICEEIASRQDRVLVFTQFRETTAPLAAFLSGIFGREGLVLHGGTPVKERQQLVKAFQAEDGPPFFVLSLKAGGTGLNLTAANHVIHFDRWWNPAVENQATDRAFRIGQHRNVLVHKFVCQGTVEEKINTLIGQKSALANDLLTGGAEALLTELSDTELLATVSLDLERAMPGV